MRGPGPRGPGQQATEGLTAPGKVWEYYAEKVVGPCGSEQGNYTLTSLSEGLPLISRGQAVKRAPAGKLQETQGEMKGLGSGV